MRAASSRHPADAHARAARPRSRSCRTRDVLQAGRVDPHVLHAVPIDAVFCDRDLVVIDVERDLKPWRTASRHGAKVVSS